MDRYSLFIVGAGAAGMSAALAAYKAGCESILIADAGNVPGGVLPQCVHRGFGLSAFGRELTGPQYAAAISSELEKTGVTLELNTCVLSVSRDRKALLSDREGMREVAFEHMILATGCREISIGALNIAGTRPAGIFTAGQAQELINLHGLRLGDKTLILGSGDLGVIMARRVTLTGGQVVAVVEKNDSYSAMARNYHRCIEKYDIPVIYNSSITELFGEERLCGVTLRRLDTGIQEYIACDTLFTAVGMIPERPLIAGLGMPPWLSLCGNCSRIHSLADSAVDEATTIGYAVGRKLNNDR